MRFLNRLLFKWEQAKKAWWVFARNLRNTVFSWRSRYRPCPSCNRLVPRGDRTCSYCGNQFSPLDRGWIGKLRQRTGGNGEEISAVQVLLAANLILFVIGIAFSLDSLFQPFTEGSPLLGILSFLSPSREILERMGWVDAPRVLNRHQFWRLVTACFLHGGLIHIYFNMSVLVNVGPVLERLLGRAKFLFLYLVTGVIGFLVSLPFLTMEEYGRKFYIPTLGASGALLGLLGGLTVYGLMQRDTRGRAVARSITKRVVFFLVLGHFIPMLNNWAHIGGFVSGGLVMFLIGDKAPRPGHRSFWKVLEVLTVLIMIGSFAFLLGEGTKRPLNALVVPMRTGPKMLLNMSLMDLHMLYLNSEANDEVFVREIELARKAGISIVSFDVPMPWPRGMEKPDYSETDRRIRRALSVSGDILVVPRFSVSAPHWWLDEHPEQRMQYEDGSRGPSSIASNTWLEAAVNSLTLFVDHLERRFGDRILGYHPCCQTTGEWFYEGVWEDKVPGFEPATLSRFRTHQVRNEAAEPEKIPTLKDRRAGEGRVFLDLSQDQWVADFHLFQQERMASVIAWFCQVIKSRTEHTKLTFVFYGYLFELAMLPGGPQTSGHLALWKLLRTPDVDVICSPFSYLDRGLGGIGGVMSPVDSASLHGKIWLMEDDTRTHLSSPDAGFGRVNSLRETEWVHRRNFAQVLTRGNGIWWMDLFGAGWLDSEEIWKNIRTLRDGALEANRKARGRSTDIAVIVDEDSLLDLAHGRDLTYPLLSRMREEIYRIGAPVSFYFWNDFLDGEVPPARMYLFLNIFRVEKDMADLARIRLMETRGGTAVWFYAPGYIRDGNQNVEGISHLTGIPVQIAANPIPALLGPGSDGVPDPIGWDHAYNPTFTVNSAVGTGVLARYRGTGVTAAVKIGQMGWNSVYVASPFVSADFLRMLAREAGVHIYSDSGDVVSADYRFLSVTARNAGKRTIHLPQSARAHPWFFPPKENPESSQTITVEMATGETRWWILVPEVSRGVPSSSERQ